MANPYASGSDSSQMAAVLKNAGPPVLCGLIGFSSAFTVPIVGMLPVGELILLVVLPWVLARTYVQRGWPTRLQQLGWYRLLVILLAFMAAGYIVSDLYRGSPGGNLLRGWARVAFLAVDLITIAYLIDGSWRRFWIFMLAHTIGGMFGSFFTDSFLEHWWEFGLGAPVISLAFFFWAGRSTLLLLTVALVLGATSMALGARSLGGITLLTGVLYGMRYARGNLRPAAFLAAAGALVALLFAANTVILSNLEKGGSNLERQSMIETAGEAFLSSPLIGQGSWFTASRLMKRLEEHRQDLDPNFHGYTEEEARTISIHSQLLVSLAEGGILGGLIFIFYGGLLLKTLRSLARFAVPHRAYALYVVIDALWNLCMSPFSGAARIAVVLAICCCLLVILQRQGELSEDFRE